ncbi:15398_t:CDS:1, partial [Funneliformis geosporum]
YDPYKQGGKDYDPYYNPYVKDYDHKKKYKRDPIAVADAYEEYDPYKQGGKDYDPYKQGGKDYDPYYNPYVKSYDHKKDY